MNLPDERYARSPALILWLLPYDGLRMFRFISVQQVFPTCFCKQAVQTATKTRQPTRSLRAKEVFEQQPLQPFPNPRHLKP